jgi:hypothetical protein
MELKNFVDFAFSLTEMQEIKDNIFVLPKEIVYNLKEVDHTNIHRQIKLEKGDNLNNLREEFSVDIFNISFKFKIKE